MKKGLSLRKVPQTLGSNNKPASIHFSYDVVFKKTNSSKIFTSFDDLKKTSTAMEVNAIMGCGVIFCLIVIVCVIFRNTFKRSIEPPQVRAVDESIEEDELSLHGEDLPPLEVKRPKNSHPSIHLKAIRNDVFRQPTFPRVFSIMVGFGMQFAMALLFTSVFLMVFFRAKQHRSQVIGALLVFYPSTGLFLGFTASLIYSTINVVEVQPGTALGVHRQPDFADHPRLLRDGRVHLELNLAAGELLLLGSPGLTSSVCSSCCRYCSTG